MVEPLAAWQLAVMLAGVAVVLFGGLWVAWAVRQWWEEGVNGLTMRGHFVTAMLLVAGLSVVSFGLQVFIWGWP